MRILARPRTLRPGDDAFTVLTRSVIERNTFYVDRADAEPGNTGPRPRTAGRGSLAGVVSSR
jgi:hypothetical protein